MKAIFPSTIKLTGFVVYPLKVIAWHLALCWLYTADTEINKWQRDSTRPIINWNNTAKLRQYRSSAVNYHALALLSIRFKVVWRTEKTFKSMSLVFSLYLGPVHKKNKENRNKIFQHWKQYPSPPILAQSKNRKCALLDVSNGLVINTINATFRWNTLTRK